MSDDESQQDQVPPTPDVKNVKMEGAGGHAEGGGPGTVFRPRLYKDGEDPDAFLRSFTRLAKANGWSEERQLAMLPALFGEAHDWLAREIEDDPTLTTFALVSERVKNRLVPAEKRRAFLHQFYEAKMLASDEPRTFVNKLKSLVKMAMPDLGPEGQDQLVMEQIPRAVPSKWQLRLLDCDANTVETVVRRLERIQTTENLQRELVQGSAEPVPVRTLSAHRGPDRRTCFRCGRQGHLAARCYSKTDSPRGRTPGGPGGPTPGGQRRNQDQQPLTCFQCGGVGHISRQCPSPRGTQAPPSSDKNKKPDQPPVRRVETAAPVEVRMLATLQGIEVPVIVDTGSPISLISEFLAVQIGEGWTPSQEALRAANGTAVRAVGRTTLEVGMGDKRTDHSFIVVEDMLDPALVGLDVLHRLGAVIDCGKEEVVLDGQRFTWDKSVRTATPVTCTARSETFMRVYRVGLVRPMLFEPDEVEGVQIARTVHMSGSGVPVRVINHGDENVVIPAGTKLGSCDPVEVTAAAGAEESATPPSRTEESATPPSTRLPEVKCEDKTKMEQLLHEYADVFSQSEEDIGSYTGKHRLVISTGDAQPVRQRAYRVPLHLRDDLRGELRKMEEQGVIEPSSSPWASPVVLVRKKNGKIRFCCDYRSVNKLIKHDSYPLPRVEDLLQVTQGSNFFSVLDQRSAYWAIPVEEQSREVTAFITEFGLHQWTRQPFGLKTSPGVFQRVMEDLLGNMNWHRAVVYLDDVIVFSRTLEEHLESLRELLQKFRQSGLKLSPEKCCVAASEVIFLGHHLDADGIRPAEEKVEAIRTWPAPTSPRALRQFLGFLGYYQQYIPDYSKKAAVLTDLLKKTTSYQWTDECQRSFQNLKEDIMKYRVLKFPDVEKEFVLTTDGSGTGWGAELKQEQGVIAFASGKWSDTELNWSATEKELGAVVKATEKFRHYLLGKAFKLRTDHQALRFLHRSKSTGKLFRWMEKLQEFEYTVEHVPGHSIPHVDALSRQDAPVAMRAEERPGLRVSAPVFVPSSLRAPSPGGVRRLQSCQKAEETGRHQLQDWATEDAGQQADGEVEGSTSLQSRSVEEDSRHPGGQQADGEVEGSTRHQSGSEEEDSRHPGSQQADGEAEGPSHHGTGPGTWRRSKKTASSHQINRVVEDAGEPVDSRESEEQDRWSCNDEEIHQEIAKDPVLSRLRQQMKDKSGKSRLEFDRLTPTQQAELRFYSGMDGLFLRDGVIRRRSEESQESQIILPVSLRAKALKLAHEVPMAGHGGIRRTLHRLTGSVFWYNIRTDVRKYVAGCQSCLANKPKNQRCQEGRGAVPVEGEPLRHWAADILELPCSRDGYRYVLVVTDMFSKLVEVFPLRRQTAVDIADCLLQVMCRYGVMCSLLTDQGRNFESKLMQEICKKLGVTKLRTSVYRPCCNGVTERFNRTLCEMLSHFADDRDWPALLPLLAAAYNTSKHSTTGLTPFELVHGSTARTLLKAEFDTPADMPQVRHSQFLQQLKEKLAKMKKAAADRISKEQASRTDVAEPVFKAGELVWCRNFTAKKGVKGKFDAKFEGPYRVVESRPPDYIIQKGKKKKRLIHGAHLKRGDIWQNREMEVSEDRDADPLKTTEAAPGRISLAHDVSSASDVELEWEEEQVQQHLPRPASQQLTPTPLRLQSEERQTPLQLPPAERQTPESDEDLEQPPDPATPELTAEDLDATGDSGGDEPHHAEAPAGTSGERRTLGREEAQIQPPPDLAPQQLPGGGLDRGVPPPEGPPVAGGRPDELPGERPGGRAGERPDERPDERPGERPGGRAGERPDERPEERPGERPRGRAGERPDERPGERPGGRPAPEQEGPVTRSGRVVRKPARFADYECE